MNQLEAPLVQKAAAYMAAAFRHDRTGADLLWADLEDSGRPAG